MENTKHIVDLLISILTVINVILYLFSWISRKPSRTIQLLALYVISLSISHFTMDYLRSKGINNLFVGHYHFGSQFLLLGLFYRSLFKPKQKKWVSITMVSVFAVFIGYYLVKPDKYADFNIIDVFITTVPLIFFSIAHLYNMLTAPRRFFIINAGILIYLTTSALIFFLGTYFHSDEELLGINDETVSNIWFINSVIYVIYLIFITIEWKSSIYKWKAKSN